METMKIIDDCIIGKLPIAPGIIKVLCVILSPEKYVHTFVLFV